MMNYHHMNFQGVDPEVGPILLSIRDVEAGDGTKLTHFILRISAGTLQQYFKEEEVEDPDSIMDCAKGMCSGIRLEYFQPVVSRRATELIADYDDKAAWATDSYTFDIIRLKTTQLVEEYEEWDPFDDFLKVIGRRHRPRRVPGSDYGSSSSTGSSSGGSSGGGGGGGGGMQNDSISTKYLQREVVFFVSTMKEDNIAEQPMINSIVAVVFEEKGATFDPREDAV